MPVVISTEANNAMFKNMNKRLVDDYRRQGIVPSMAEHVSNFEQVYGVKIVGDSGWARWDHVEFPSEEALTIAALTYL